MSLSTVAEVRFPSPDVQEDINFFTQHLGFRLDQIYPADQPAVAVLSGHGVRLRLETGAKEPLGTVRLLVDRLPDIANGASCIFAPNGLRVEFASLSNPLTIPETEHTFVVRHLRDQAPWVIGRAGMQYRDLIPSRLGGGIIASHIRIPKGGPVPDMVHYHTVGFQLIYCYRGWVDLVYEDQGPPFRLEAGDCLIQPPEIRHRVLYASDNIEVVEIAVPSEHLTTIDHEMTLPNDRYRPDREFQGQTFVRHQAGEANWSDFRIPGFSHCDTGITQGTKGVASVHMARYEGGFPPATQHDSDILFNFVLEGSMTLAANGEQEVEVSPGDAFVIPPDLIHQYTRCSPDLELLEVSLPGRFNTQAIDH